MNPKRLFCAAAFTAITMFYTSIHAQTIFVDVQAAGTGNGSSWADAYTTIQAALDDPAAASGEVWVAQGDYAETIALNTGNRVFGGFTSGATDLGQRDPVNTPSVIDASGIAAPNNAVTIDSVTGTVFDGFTVMGGNANDATLVGPSAGGGIYCVGLDNTNLINNVTITGNSAYYGGAGIYLASCDNRITNCTIIGNTTMGDFDSGGGIAAFSETTTEIRDCMIQMNISKNGGGVAMQNASQLSLVDTTIQGNTARSSGGGIYVSRSTNTLTRCIISNNVAQSGGGMFGGFEASGSFLNCVFMENAAQNPESNFGSGGGGYLSGANSHTFVNCQFHGNSAPDNNGDGGAMRVSNTTAIFDDCIFAENFANRRGGGIYASGNTNSPSFDGCVFYGNRTPTDGGISSSGGGIYASEVITSITDSIFAGNESRLGAAFEVGQNTTVHVARTTISGNIAQNAIIQVGGPSICTLTNCVIAGNMGLNEEGWALNVQTPMRVQNCTIADQEVGMRLVGSPSNPIVPSIANSIFTNLEYGIIEQFENDNTNIVNSVFYNNSPADYADSTGGPQALLDITGPITGGIIENNVQEDPKFKMDTFERIAGTWVSVDYDAPTSRTTLSADGGPFAGMDLSWRFVNPTTDTLFQSFILSHTDNTLTVYGDAWGAEAGDAFKIIDYDLSSGSAAVDFGIGERVLDDQQQGLMITMTAPLVDLRERTRPVDIMTVGMDGNGEGFDAGAFEWDGEPPSVSLMLLVDYLLGSSNLPSELLPGADKNADGVVDVGDVVTTVNE